MDQYGLPYPEAVFDIQFFRRNPRPFFELAKDLHPGKLGLEPTLTHFFIVLLARKGMLRRMYTQNIDTLERLAGLPPDKLVEAHGSFASATCTRCSATYDAQWVQRAIQLDPTEDVDIVPRCEACAAAAPVKPDITFFGEELPERFKQLAAGDMAAADMCLVLGSSLQVAPVNGLFTQVPSTCPRVLINLHSAGEAMHIQGEEDLQGLTQEQLATLIHADGDGGFRFNLPDNYRDVFLQGKCDEQVLSLAEAAGWKDELLQLQASELQRLHDERAQEAAAAVAKPPPTTPAQGAAVPGSGDTQPNTEPAEHDPASSMCPEDQVHGVLPVGALSLQQALEGAAATAVRVSGAEAGSQQAQEAAAAGEAAAHAAWHAGGMSVLDDALAVLAAPSEAISPPAPQGALLDGGGAAAAEGGVES